MVFMAKIRLSGKISCQKIKYQPRFIQKVVVIETPLFRIDSLKSRNLRLYSNVVKALYDDGPYVLSPPYHMFRKSYEDWKSMSPDERKKHISAFMTYVPTDDVLLRARVGN